MDAVLLIQLRWSAAFFAHLPLLEVLRYATISAVLSFESLLLFFFAVAGPGVVAVRTLSLLHWSNCCADDSSFPTICGYIFPFDERASSS